MKIKMYAIYPITIDGNPRHPLFVSKTKIRARWYLEYLHEKWHWEKPEDYYIEEVRVTIPLIGARRRVKEFVINQEVIEIREA